MSVTSDTNGTLSVIVGHITYPIGLLDLMWPVPFLKQLWKDNRDNVFTQPEALDRLILRGTAADQELALTRTDKSSSSRTWSVWYRHGDSDWACHKLTEHREGKPDIRRLMTIVEMASKSSPAAMPSFGRAFITLTRITSHFPGLDQLYDRALAEDAAFRKAGFKQFRHH